MENINRSQKLLIIKSFKYKPSLNHEFSTIKSSGSNNNNLRKIYNSYNNLRKKDAIKSKIKNKNKITLNKNTEKSQSSLSKNHLFKILLKANNNNNYNNNKIQEVKKVDAFTQKSIFKKKVYRIKSNFLKHLSDNIPKKNKNEIDYVLESPYRGIEKIQYSSPTSNNVDKQKNIFSPIFINNIYEGYFCKNNLSSNLLSDGKNFALKTSGNNKLYIDKYTELNKTKDINNPLKRLAKLSGVSCNKLREVINYSLGNKMKKVILGKKNQSKKSINNKKCKNIYSFISLKSTKSKSFKNINNYLDKDNEATSENVICSKRFNGIKPFCDISKSGNGYA